MKIPDSIIQKAIDHTNQGIIISNTYNKIIFINEAAKQLLNLWTNIKVIPDYIVSNHNGILKVENKYLYLFKKSVDEHSLTIWYLTDITKEQLLDDTIFFYSTILNNITEGIIVSDPTGKIIMYNKQLAEFEDLQPEKTIGQHLTKIYATNSETSEHMMVAKTGTPLFDLQRHYFTRDGREIDLVASTYPIEKNGKTVAVYSVSRNIKQFRRLLEKYMELLENINLDAKVNTLINGTKYSFEDIIGNSTSINKVKKQARMAALTNSPILIYGETGTGKELFVQSIHNAGPNKNQPFVAINCAAIPENLLESILFGTAKGAFTGATNTIGLFQQAGKGTLFLDEINSMPMSLQAKLLRVLQERTVRRIGSTVEDPILCRIISSTNVDPYQCINSKILREDLYYRLAVIYLQIPPLRERPGDIQLLSEFFINKFSRLFGKIDLQMSQEYQNALSQNSWPGNVRELQHTLESSITMLETDSKLTLYHLPINMKQMKNKKEYSNYINSSTLSNILQETEKQALVDALNHNDWNITQAAKSLGIRRSNMQYRMRKLEIKNPSQNKNHL